MTLSEQNNLGLTLVISAGDAVFHFAIESRVLITCSESPDARSRLALSHLEGSLICPGESGRDVIHIQNINQHLGRDRGAD